MPVSARARELAAAAQWQWPVDITAELTADEADAVRVLELGGRPWLFNLYRRRLRELGRSWMGIPTAELTPYRMAVVLVLLQRAENAKRGCTFPAPCTPDWCGTEDHGGHQLTIRIE